MKQNLALLFFTLAFLTSSAQDPELTQFYNSPIYSNPAFTGSSGANRVAMNYRNQYTSLGGTYTTYIASYDADKPSMAGGWGLMFVNDQAGVGIYTSNVAGFSYAYHTKLNRRGWNLRAGMQASVHQRSLDFSKLTFSDQIDPRLGFIHPKSQEPLPPNQKITFPNFNTGILFYNDKYYAGLAIHNLTEPNQSWYKSNAPGTRLPRRYTLSAGMSIQPNRFDDNFIISPNILVMVQEQFTQANFGFFISKAKFTTGLWWRQTRSNADALMMMVGCKLANLRLAYSLDLTVSTLSTAARSSHEVSLLFVFNNPARKGPGKLECYGF